MFYTYILYSQIKDRYYIGHTEDISRRIIEHNTKRNLGTNDWVLKYSQSFETRSEAMRRELEIKNKKRKSYIEKLISSQNSPD